MWLLSTSGNELRSFVSPEEVISKEGGFAILSHTWGDHEQSLQDVQAVIRKAAKTGANARELLSAKIRDCCKLAEREGYKWVWIDTCCIDKTSSAELSEAINSMYRYYSLASVCYVYLEDWHAKDCVPTKLFCECRWHSRGWTLQELIAPKSVFFFNRFWHRIGSKTDITHELQLATRIPTPLLLAEAKPSEFSLAERMSWAAKRQTTREEDEAYSLLGIFGVNMPTIYGEGRKAFRRLQEEIMRQDPDPTLFAWGLVAHSTSPRRGIAAMRRDISDPDFYDLLASCPADFTDSNTIEYHDQKTRNESRLMVPQITMTPLGVHITSLWVARISTKPDLFLADFFLRHSQSGRGVYFVLAPSGERHTFHELNSTSTPMQFWIRALSAASRSYLTPLRPSEALVRLVCGDPRHSLQGGWEQKEVYFPTIRDTRRPSVYDELPSLRYGIRLYSSIAATNDDSDVPTRFSAVTPFRMSLSRLASGYESGGFILRLINFSLEDQHRFELLIDCMGNGHSAFVISLGVCPVRRRRTWLRRYLLPKAPSASIFHRSTFDTPHDCSKDHVLDWRDLTKSFCITDPKLGGASYTITLRFTDVNSDSSMLWMNDLVVSCSSRESSDS